jgi:hypothetical protein
MSDQYSNQNSHHGLHGAPKGQQLLGESMGIAPGLIARDARRQRATTLVREPPCIECSAVVVRESRGLLWHVRDGIRALMMKPPHSLPPRIWYRLVSLGDPFSAHQEGAQFGICRLRQRRGALLLAPSVMRDSLEQVLVVTRRGRIVLEVATKVGDAGWLLRGSWAYYVRDASLVLVLADKRQFHLRCKKVQSST